MLQSSTVYLYRSLPEQTDPAPALEAVAAVGPQEPELSNTARRIATGYDRVTGFFGRGWRFTKGALPWKGMWNLYVKTAPFAHESLVDERERHEKEEKRRRRHGNNVQVYAPESETGIGFGIGMDGGRQCGR